MRALLALAAMLAGCVTPPADTTTPTQPPDAGEVSIAIASAAFARDGAIPEKHTCDGENVSPPLSIAVSGSVASVAMIVFDPDAPTPQLPQRNITHWLVWSLSPANATIAFPEGGVPAGAVQGANVGGEPEYAGPCPPLGSPAHRYVFTAFALDAAIVLPEGSERAELERAIEGHDLATATLTGTYARALPP